MTDKEFLYNIRRGMGKAIIELQKNPNSERYCDIILRCCQKNIAYNWQVEGTKGRYLYSAICALGSKEQKDKFEDILIDTFKKRLEYDLFLQIADILCLYAADGSQKSRDALQDKYRNLVERLSKQKTFPLKYSERGQFEYLMVWEIDTNKWAAFERCIADAGRILINRRDDACNCYDDFILHCENIFGKKRIANYFENSAKKSNKSKEVNAYITAANELEKTRAENLRLRKEQPEPKINLESYVVRAKEAEHEQCAYAHMAKLSMQFAKQGKPDEFMELASIIAAEQSDEVRANLLNVFRNVDFPADIDLLIKYAESDCPQLCDIAIVALKRFADPRVHELAIKLITAGNIEAGLSLLVKNWRKQDEALIRKYILSVKKAKISHSTQQNLRDIYLTHRSKSCGDILEYAYHNGECAHCRFGIVDAMMKNRVLSESISSECIYDSYDKTRELAKKAK